MITGLEAAELEIKRLTRELAEAKRLLDEIPGIIRVTRLDARAAAIEKAAKAAESYGNRCDTYIPAAIRALVKP